MHPSAIPTTSALTMGNSVWMQKVVMAWVANGLFATSSSKLESTYLATMKMYKTVETADAKIPSSPMNNHRPSPMSSHLQISERHLAM